jgi:hypothetical protein
MKINKRQKIILVSTVLVVAVVVGFVTQLSRPSKARASMASLTATDSSVTIAQPGTISVGQADSMTITLDQPNTDTSSEQPATTGNQPTSNSITHATSEQTANTRQPATSQPSGTFTKQDVCNADIASANGGTTAEYRSIDLATERDRNLAYSRYIVEAPNDFTTYYAEANKVFVKGNQELLDAYNKNVATVQQEGCTPTISRHDPFKAY